MKKLFQSRTVSLIIIVAALIPLRAEVAQAQHLLPDLGVDYEGRTVVITDISSNTVTYCGRPFTEYNVVIHPVGPQSAPAIVTTIAVLVNSELAIKVGDLFNIQQPTQACPGRISVVLARNRPAR